MTNHVLASACVLFLLAPGATAAQQGTATADFIAAYARSHNFNGSVLVAKRGRTVYTGAFGMANFGLKVPNTTETKYWIASITKLFTATLVMQLHEQGKLDLDATIGTCLPDYPGPGRDKVTIRQLLHHTSGIRNYDQVRSARDAVENGLPNYQHPYTSQQLMTKFASGPLEHEPGSTFDYNNGDYVILGKIIEKLTGGTYDAVLEQRILAPLAMKDSGILHQRDIVPGLADDYFYRDDIKALVPDLPVYPENWYAAGAMYSTLADLRTFADALFAGRLVSRRSLAMMFEPELDDYGFGLWSYDTKVGGESYKVVKRPGQIMGAQAELYHVFQPGVTVIILSNTGTTDLDEFVAAIGEQVVGGK